MFKVVRLYLSIALFGVLLLPQASFAATGDALSATNWGSSLTFTVDIFGTNKPAVAQVFGPSGNVSINADVDSSGTYYWGTAQHLRGTRLFGKHSMGGPLRYRTVTTGTAGTVPLAASSAPTTDFPESSTTWITL